MDLVDEDGRLLADGVASFRDELRFLDLSGTGFLDVEFDISISEIFPDSLVSYSLLINGKQTDLPIETDDIFRFHLGPVSFADPFTLSVGLNGSVNSPNVFDMTMADVRLIGITLTDAGGDPIFGFKYNTSSQMHYPIVGGTYAVPEPSTAVLAALGVLSLLAAKRSRCQGKCRSGMLSNHRAAAAANGDAAA
jgi:hypothetical protein